MHPASRQQTIYQAEGNDSNVICMAIQFTQLERLESPAGVSGKKKERQVHWRYFQRE
jgi:hypothetical protein